MDKYYNYEAGKDIIDDAEYLLDTADDEYIAQNFDKYVAAMEIHLAAERRVRKTEIEKRRLNKIHQEKLKRGKIRAYIGGSVAGICIALATPAFLGGEMIANKVYGIMTEAGYGFNDYENGIVFNKGTHYVDYNDAVENIRDLCYANGMSAAEVDVGLKKIIHATPENSTMSERLGTEVDEFLGKNKTEDKVMGK